MAANKLLIIGCGALAREIEWLKRQHQWQHVDLQCVDAELHNRPELIAPRVAHLIEKHRPNYRDIFVAYADCGSGGQLDKVLSKWNIERLPGAHCYAFYAGESTFNALSEENPATFYLTDFLARHFERLVVRGLKLDEHPQLKPQLFKHYQRVVYLQQAPDPAIVDAAQRAAAWLDLPLSIVKTGLGDLGRSLHEQVIHLHNSGRIDATY